MNLADLTLDIASFSIGLEEYPVTSYVPATGTITCNMLEGQTGTYGGATLWYYDDAGKCRMTTIERQSGRTIVIHNPPDDAPTKIYIAPAKPFDMQKFANAVNQVLAIYPVMGIDTSLDVVEEQREYKLPSGVSDIRRVEYWQGNAYTICHYWRINGNKLEFYDYVPSDTAEPIRLHYVKNHGRVAVPDGTVDDVINLKYVRYIAYLNLYREQLTTRKRDNSIAGDIYNEGKMYEQILRDRSTGKLHLMVKDFTYAAV
jgi:hypothetical protein